MKGLILTAIGTASLTGGGAYAYFQKQETVMASLRADNARLATAVNTRNAAIDSAIETLQKARDKSGVDWSQYAVKSPSK